MKQYFQSIQECATHGNAEVPSSVIGGPGKLLHHHIFTVFSPTCCVHVLKFVEGYSCDSTEFFIPCSAIWMFPKIGVPQNGW